ncbi:hypothetical protein [Leifsonia shinshuensis]|uniref:Uncharacterized protein n=1 Tax=Leifsonia shinshuensis TaxID=150026 RepID=A0A7G6YBL5_9MICO|nr:hypothetical protein [Leifsonia shinshuensis]QNE35880.1 hypothetical protein F1C12_12580 [Leifsonia shinshuensis]
MDAIDVYATTGHLLRIGDMFPEFTFGPPNENCQASLIPGLSAILAALAASCDEPQLWALWLSGQLLKHGGWCAVDALLTGETVLVLERARNEDWSWTVDDLP